MLQRFQIDMAVTAKVGEGFEGEVFLELLFYKDWRFWWDSVKLICPIVPINGERVYQVLWRWVYIVLCYVVVVVVVAAVFARQFPP